MKSQGSSSQRPGFTLLEMMVVLAIFAIISGAIFMTMSSGRISWQTNEAAVQIQEDLRRGLRTIGQELRESGRVDSTAHVVINGSNDVIVFQIPIDANSATPEFDLSAGQILWGAEGTVGYALRYRRNGSQLMRDLVDSFSLGASTVGTARVLANNITSVVFTQVPASGDITGVDTALTAQKTSLAQHMMTLTETLHVVLRNVY